MSSAQSIVERIVGLKFACGKEFVQEVLSVLDAVYMILSFERRLLRERERDALLP